MVQRIYTSAMKKQKDQIGFTLIELLIVIGILGILAAVLLVTINPLEQLSRGRDTGRVNQVVVLGKALNQYSTTNGGAFPVTTASEITALVTAGELGNASGISNPVGGTMCTVNVYGGGNGFCYNTFLNGTNNDAAVWAPAESSLYKSKVTCAANTYPYIIYIVSQGKAGVACLGAAASPTSATTLN